MKQKKSNPGANRSETAKSTTLSPKERILQTAQALFYQHGIHAVGIDRIIAESGVAKMTFYRHFPAKANLIAEYLASKQRAWRELLESFLNDKPKPPLEKLLAIFDALSAAIREQNFCGCPFIKALAEYGAGEDEPAIGQQVALHFAEMEKLVAGLLKQIHPKDKERFVQPLMSLINGTIVVAQATGRTDTAARNKELVRVMLSSGPS